VDLPGRTLLQAVVRDITDRLEAAAAQQRLEEQLRQASRMEAIGRLAGGVAHDFNNILTVILGTSELALVRLPAGERMRNDLEEIRRSAQRAAALTAQLLSFSRKQVVAPVASDLNALVSGALAMLHRLIGEDVRLVVEPAASLQTVLVDRTQLEQVLVNLAVNARDAMPQGGRLVIATGEADFTEADAGGRPGARPGRFVRLDVSDDGAGIPAELLEHVFEPFFTTKEFGRGTGLGLSTVYSIVRQSGGFIELDSTPGKGTRFSLFFPAVSVAPETAAVAEVESHPRGDESILLVEDDSVVRELTRRVLMDLGYAVHAAGSGEAALGLAANQALRVDLLLTDVVMPGISGKQLYDRLTRMRPGLRVVFMSGYTANILAPHGVLEPGTVLLQKPFPLNTLASTVRRVLDRVAVA
jgi:nitrogen-specific signal transduction histidine kinase/ActR/RegA family two-component response regulator